MFDFVCYYPKQAHIAITQKQLNFVQNALANGCQKVMTYNVRPRAAKGLINESQKQLYTHQILRVENSTTAHI